MTAPEDFPSDDGMVTESVGPEPPSSTRRRPHGPVRGRSAALASVAVIVVGVTLVSAALPVPSAVPAPGPTDGVAIAPADAQTSSTFCSAGTGTAAASTIYLTNTTSKVVDGEMNTVGPAGGSGPVPTSRRTVEVPPLGSAAVNPSIGMPAGSTASSFVFAGGGVAADQVVSGPGGWSTAPCASRVSGQWTFAGGSTTSGNALTLSLFDPTAAQVVVNVSFLTASGVITPQAYQGLTVLPGQLAVENVGDFVQNEPDIATFVTAESGTLVADELQQWSSGPTGGISVRLGSPGPSTTWRFAQTAVTEGSTLSFSLANPGSSPVTARFSLGLPSASVVPQSVVVPSLSIVAFKASGVVGWPKTTPYSVTVDATAPIVVGRSVLAATGATPPVWGSSSGTVVEAAHWLMPGPGVPNAPGVAGATVRSLAVANPGQAAVRVVVAAFGRVRPVAVLTVGPGAMAVLGADQVGGIDGGLATFSVSASQPVVVEIDDGPTGARGVVSSSGFPFGG